MSSSYNSQYNSPYSPQQVPVNPSDQMALIHLVGHMFEYLEDIDEGEKFPLILGNILEKDIRNKNINFDEIVSILKACPFDEELQDKLLYPLQRYIIVLTKFRNPKQEVLDKYKALIFRAFMKAKAKGYMSVYKEMSKYTNNLASKSGIIRNTHIKTPKFVKKFNQQARDEREYEEAKRQMEELRKQKEKESKKNKGDL